MDEQKYILNDVCVHDSAPTVNEYETYDHDHGEYVDGTLPDSTNYMAFNQPYNESTDEQQHIDVTNNWALSH